MNQKYEFVLTIDRFDPDRLTENRELDIFFTLRNCSGQPTDGYVWATIFPGAPDPAVSSTGWYIAPLADGNSATGAVKVVLPQARSHYRLLLHYQENMAKVISAIAETSLEVSARYTWSLDSLHADFIRGGSNDQDFAIMTLAVGNEFDFMTRKEAIGKVLAGDTVQFPKSMQITFDVLPGRERENTVLANFLVVNRDRSPNANILKDILNEISDSLDALASIFVPGDSMHFVNDRMHSVHASMFPGICDGVVAADSISVTGATLDDWTETLRAAVVEPPEPETGDVHTETKTYDADKAAVIGCGNHGSVYKITWTFRRLRNDDGFHVTPWAAVVEPGKTFTFHVSDPNIPIVWTIDGAPLDGSFDDFYGQIDTGSGQYTAPLITSDNDVRIIRATADDASGRYALGFVVVRERHKVFLATPLGG